MLGCKTFETDWKLDIARTDNVLNLEVRELGVETELLDDARILARRQLGVVFRLGTSDDHLAGGEDQSSGLWVSDTHDNRSETLWVVLSVTRMQSTKSVSCQPQKTCRFTHAMVFKSKRQFKLTVATKFCSVGTMPLTPLMLAAPGVAAGVAGATPFGWAMATCCCGADPSDGGVRSFAAVG